MGDIEQFIDIKMMVLTGDDEGPHQEDDDRKDHCLFEVGRFSLKRTTIYCG